jgi:hypothetical protein
MSLRTRIVTGASLMLVVTVAAVALLTPGNVKPVGRLSRQDVLDIRAAVRREQSPRWSWFGLANLRSWPIFLRQKATFRIVDVEADVIESRDILFGGTLEESKHPVTVWFTFSGFPTNTCRVIRSKGVWKVFPYQVQGLRGLTFFRQRSPRCHPAHFRPSNGPGRLRDGGTARLFFA